MPLLAFFPQTAPDPSGMSVGIEWMVIVSVVLPILLLVALLYAGTKRV